MPDYTDLSGELVINPGGSGLPTVSTIQFRGQAYQIVGAAVGDIESVTVSSLNFTNDLSTATVTVRGAVGTAFDFEIVSPDPAGWITVGALGAASGTISTNEGGEHVFTTTLTIPTTGQTVDRTFTIRAVERGNPNDFADSGLIRYQNDVSTVGNLTVGFTNVIVGTDLTFTAHVTSGDPDFTLQLYDTDPRTGAANPPTDPAPIQTATLTETGTHMFMSIDTSMFDDGVHTYFLRVVDRDNDIVVESESITISRGDLFTGQAGTLAIRSQVVRLSYLLDPDGTYTLTADGFTPGTLTAFRGRFYRSQTSSNVNPNPDSGNITLTRTDVSPNTTIVTPYDNINNTVTCSGLDVETNPGRTSVSISMWYTTALSVTTNGNPECTIYTDGAGTNVFSNPSAIGATQYGATGSTRFSFSGSGLTPGVQYWVRVVDTGQSLSSALVPFTIPTE